MVRNQLQCHPVDTLRDPGKCEVLHPNAGMEQLGLMPGDHERSRRCDGWPGRAIVIEISLGQPLDFVAGERAKFAQGQTIDTAGCLVESMALGRERRNRFGQRWLDQQRTIPTWCPIAAWHQADPGQGIGEQAEVIVFPGNGIVSAVAITRR